MSRTLSRIRRYPVKSCRGEDLSSAVVEPWGLAGDRRWMVVDDDGMAITARTDHALLLVHPRLTPAGLRVTSPSHPSLDVATPDPAAQVPVGLWASRLSAAPAGEVADAWFSAVIGRSARLVWLDDPARRPTSPEFSEATDRVSFADGYPLLVTTEESLAALDDEVLAGAHQAREPLSMIRFRPSVVVRGGTAWEEDDWRRVKIGGVTFRAVKGCARCVLTTVDPDSAERGKEPIASLARIRRWDGATWFGVNLVPDDPGATIVIGDPVEVLESVSTGGGPIRRQARP